jgi:hypothetical protein
MNRKEGYYWVKHFGKWTIGYWKEKWEWELFSIQGSCSDTDLDQINETQILPPNN